LEEYLTALTAINLDNTKIHNFDTSKFKTAKSIKERKILTWAKENKIEKLEIN